MLNARRRRPLGPGEKIVAAVLGLVLMAGLTTAVAMWAADDGEGCPDGLERVEGSCMALSGGDFTSDPELEGLLRVAARENKAVEQDGGPSRRVALTMPFSSEKASAMPLELIKHGLAGALAAQRRANDGSGPKYQLVLADVGRRMENWQPVVDKLVGLTRDEAPLIATVGLPSSTKRSEQAIKSLARHEIPSIGPVITSSDMNAGRYFFKTSPSNEHFVKALKQYLDDNPKDPDSTEDGGDGEDGKGEDSGESGESGDADESDGSPSRTGFLVVDDSRADTYSRDLERRVLDTFEDEYDLERNSTSFVGTRGEESGTPNLFRVPVFNICAARADTVFYAGRDEDLPALIERLASSGRCGYEKPLRIVKVGIGMPPELTGKQITERMREADIRVVNAAAVDPGWQEKNASKPSGFETFRSNFQAVTKGQKLSGQPLDDGYAPMYYDAFTAVSEASGLAFEDVGEEGQASEDPDRVRKDVHNKLLNLNPDRRGEVEGCSPCVQGAAGTYGFNRRTSPGLWPVCKSIHMLEHPVPKSREEKDGESGDAPPTEPYRTYGEEFSGNCPKGE